VITQCCKNAQLNLFGPIRETALHWCSLWYCDISYTFRRGTFKRI